MGSFYNSEIRMLFLCGFKYECEISKSFPVPIYRFMHVYYIKPVAVWKSCSFWNLFQTASALSLLSSYV